jgi:anti-sigma B factor antagonist
MARAEHFVSGGEVNGLGCGESRIGHRAVLAISGEIDIATADAFRAAIEQIIAADALDVWVDLSDVGFIDSRGVRALIDARGAASARHKRFVVICPPGPVYRVMEITGVAAVLTIHPDRASAHAAS